MKKSEEFHLLKLRKIRLWCSEYRKGRELLEATVASREARWDLVVASWTPLGKCLVQQAVYKPVLGSKKPRSVRWAIQASSRIASA